MFPYRPQCQTVCLRFLHLGEEGPPARVGIQEFDATTIASHLDTCSFTTFLSNRLATEPLPLSLTNTRRNGLLQAHYWRQHDSERTFPPHTRQLEDHLLNSHLAPALTCPIAFPLIDFADERCRTMMLL